MSVAPEKMSEMSGMPEMAKKMANKQTAEKDSNSLAEQQSNIAVKTVEKEKKSDVEKAKESTLVFPKEVLDDCAKAAEFFRDLLKKGNIDIKRDGKELLSLAFKHARSWENSDSTPDSHNPDKHNFEQIIIQLISQGVDVNLEIWDKSLLFIAVTHGFLQLTKFLVEHKADLDKRDSYGGLLSLAVRQHGPKSNEILEYLLQSGLDVNQRNSRGSNALSAVLDYIFTPEQMQSKIKILLKHHINIYQVNDQGHTILDGDIDYSWCPLYLSCLKLLLANATVDQVVNPSNGVTAFHKAAKYGFTGVMQLLVANTLELETVSKAASQVMTNVGQITGTHIFGAWESVSYGFEDEEKEKQEKDRARQSIHRVMLLLTSLGASPESIETAQKNVHAQKEDFSKQLQDFSKQLQENTLRLRMHSKTVPAPDQMREQLTKLLQTLNYKVKDFQMKLDALEPVLTLLASARQSCAERTADEIQHTFQTIRRLTLAENAVAATMDAAHQVTANIHHLEASMNDLCKLLLVSPRARASMGSPKSQDKASHSAAGPRSSGPGPSPAPGIAPIPPRRTDTKSPGNDSQHDATACFYDAEDDAGDAVEVSKQSQITFP